ncbi:MAG: FG-GAP repeat domain-containing protein [Planctomycetales bacterium]
MIQRLFLLVVLGAALPWGAGGAACSAADEPDGGLAEYYGFGRLELFKLQQRSGNMLAADLNQDGRTDLVLIDNSNSRLDLLVQRDPKAAPAMGGSRARVNAIENDKRFEHRKIPVDREVASLAVGDFNGDGRTDLAWFALPDQLTIAWQSERGDWAGRKKIRLADVEPALWILAAGDLNSDGKDDLVVLGKHDTYLVYQQAGGELAAPQRLMNTTDKLGLAQIVDLDGDGRNDLCYLTGADGERPLCVRLQRAQGKLGPELRCELPKPRGVTFANIDGKPGAEILGIEAQTGRVKVHQLQLPATQPGDPAGQLIQFGFGQQGSGKNRDLAVGDLDGDGLSDVVVTDPDAAQMIVFSQQAGTGLDLGSPFPGLVGAEQVRVGDVDGDRRAEVFVLSTKEKTIGLSRMQEGRLTFPQGIALDKEPAALELADLNGDGRRELVVIGRERTGQSSKFTLEALTLGEGGMWRPYPFGPHASIGLTLKNNPERLVVLDANRDGKSDFLVFSSDSERPPVFLLSDAQGVPAEVPAAEGGFGLGKVASGGLFLGMLDQPVILVAQSNFARNIAVGEKNQWQVLDQYNAAESETKIVGVATIDLDGQPEREIVLVDQGVKKLRILRREGMVYRPWREVEIGAFPYKSTHVADLDGDGREDLLLFGAGKFGILYAGRTDPRLKTIATYESRNDKMHFNDLAAGDLNADGQMDVVVIDTQLQLADILNFTPAGGLRHALEFKVFEAKSLAGEERTGNEPREALIADVTGDGLPDLVILSHDRVLVYPQDAGDDPGRGTTAGK